LGAALVEPILIPVSAGELLDKKAILEIKRERIKDAGQLANVDRELAMLDSVARTTISANEAAAIKPLETELRAINEGLWNLENQVRAFERNGCFGDEFIHTARQIYAGNDRRAAVKKQINLLLKSSIVEEKSHN
jgi:hypothetical protein